MRFTETDVLGAVVIDVDPMNDDRGFFGRIWCQQEFMTRGLNGEIAQINVGFGRAKGTLRGLHYQVSPHEEVKVVRCTRGSLYDVALDLRPESVTYKSWVGVYLTAENHRMLYIPEGCAHGYLTLEDDTELCYSTSALYSPESATGVRYDDPLFGIRWPMQAEIISDKDRCWPLYTEAPLRPVSEATDPRRSIHDHH
jgi:dTDP-4-dehydrorhamnose 3,5-epimerase